MKKLIVFTLAVSSASVLADTVVTLHQVNTEGVGAEIGEIRITESAQGLVLTPSLMDLEPGLHGFHLHQNPSCQPAEENGEMTAAASAGGHYDPENTNLHSTPWGDGHLGDLPALFVDDEGNAAHAVLASRLQPEDISGRALVIHSGGDNYSDQPEELGGGGERVACGVIE